VRPGLRYESGDASGWTHSGPPFDLAVSFETVEHLPDPAALVRRLAGLLSPGGQLIISAPNTLQYQRGTPAVANPYHLSEPDYATLSGWLAPHFAIESEWEQSPTLGRFDGQIPGLEANVRASRRYRWTRFFDGIEKAGRALVGRSLPIIPAPALRGDPLIASTAILPLLPERRAACDVFLFVCRHKA
jgi:SAM-dependent methyltransferase